MRLVGEGYDVIRWLEERLRSEGVDRVPAELNIHSANAVGARNIIASIRSIARVIPMIQLDYEGRTWRRVDQPATRLQGER